MTSEERSGRPATRVALLIACVATALLLALTAKPALADFGVTPGSFTADVVDQNGDPMTQAGAHPFAATTSFSFNTHAPNGYDEPDGNVRDVEVTLPPGLVGNPNAVPKCTGQELVNMSCPIDSQVGVTELNLQNGSFYITDKQPVYNMEPPPGVTAAFAFKAVGISPVWIYASVKTDGTFGTDQYSLVTRITSISQLFPMSGSKLTFWGVPADPAHDPDRYDPSTFSFGVSTNAEKKPFLTLPSVCGVPGTTKLRVRSWQEPDTWLSYETAPQTLTGCDKQSFEPTISVTPDTTAADSPSGLLVDLGVPQSDTPSGLGTPPLMKAVVTLPDGVSISPSAADGLAGCSQSQIGLGTTNEPACPDASKIGTVEIDTPLLSDPMTGSIYLASPADNPFGSMFAIYAVAKGPGLILKLPGKVEPDPATGRLTTTFDNNPLLPFTHFKLHFKGGSRAPLALPETCGAKTTTAQLSSYAGQVAAPSDSFAVDANCTPASAASFSAGVLSPLAGGSSPFTLTVRRPDGGPQLDSIVATLPPGLTGRLASVPACPDAQAAAGTCAAASQVGTVTVGAGPGANPYYLSGKAYLTGPYKGAPLGLSMVVPALAGPFDLGTVVVRAAIDVDRHDAHLTVRSDSLPSILKGVPLRLRTVNVTMDRPGFMLNPTSCAPKEVVAVAGGGTVRSRFQVGGCSKLDYAPRMSAKLGGGRRAMRAGGKPSLTVNLRQGSGQANSRRITVTLPSRLGLQPAPNLGLCSVSQRDAANCPASSKVGSASAVTPLLGNKLSGPVYLVEGPGGRGLPRLSIFLDGQLPIQIDGSTSLVRGAVRNTFDGIPDVPLRRFTLKLDAGKLLSPKSSLCSRRQYVRESALGQNGARAYKRLRLGTTCSSASKSRKARARRARPRKS